MHLSPPAPYGSPALPRRCFEPTQVLSPLQWAAATSQQFPSMQLQLTAEEEAGMEAGAGQSTRPMQPVEVLSPFTAGRISQQADEDDCRDGYCMISGERAATCVPPPVETQAVESCTLPPLMAEEAGGRGPLRVEEAGDPLLLPQAGEEGVLQNLLAGAGCTVEQDRAAAEAGVVMEPGQRPAGLQPDAMGVRPVEAPAEEQVGATLVGQRPVGSLSDAVQSGAMRDVQLEAPTEDRHAEAPVKERHAEAPAEDRHAEAPTEGPQPDAGAMRGVHVAAPMGPQPGAGRSPRGRPGADVVEAALYGAPATEVAASALHVAPAAWSEAASEASACRGATDAAEGAAAEGAAADGQRLSQEEAAAAGPRPHDACGDEDLQVKLPLLPPAFDHQQQGVRMSPPEGAEVAGHRPGEEKDEIMELQLTAGLPPSASDHQQGVRAPTPPASDQPALAHPDPLLSAGLQDQVCNALQMSGGCLGMRTDRHMYAVTSPMPGHPK